MNTPITLEVAQKVLAVVDAGLSDGLGKPIPGQMCVEAAVNYALGLPHDDRPACVAPALRSLKIALNDKPWSSETARAKGLRRLALAQLGSAGVLDEKEFARLVAESVIRKQVPLAYVAYAAAYAADAAAYVAAYVTAYVAYADATDANSGAAERDKVLSHFAEDIVQILVEMKAPGCQWLVLTEGGV